MTREEAIKVLSESIHSGSKVPWDKIVEEVHLSIEALSQPSLPSNLDDAAKEYLDEVFGKREHHHFNIDLFKAGAEWMAKQGYSYEDKVYLLDGGDTYESYPGLDGEGEKQCIDKAVKVGYLKVGDKVIVQIRKKED